MADDAERRRDARQRELIERIADAAGKKGGEHGARIVMQEIGRIVPHDLSTHDGRAAMGSDLYHLNKSRLGCEKFKSVAGGTIVKTGFGAVTIAIVYAVWSAIAPHFNIGPK